MTSFSLLGQAVWICIEEKQLIDQSIQLGSVAGPVIQATGRLETGVEMARSLLVPPA